MLGQYQTPTTTRHASPGLSDVLRRPIQGAPGAGPAGPSFRRYHCPPEFGRADGTRGSFQSAAGANPEYWKRGDRDFTCSVLYDSGSIVFWKSSQSLTRKDASQKWPRQTIASHQPWLVGFGAPSQSPGIGGFSPCSVYLGLCLSRPTVGWQQREGGKVMRPYLDGNMENSERGR